jgi:hypothetical protein
MMNSVTPMSYMRFSVHPHERTLQLLKAMWQYVEINDLRHDPSTDTPTQLHPTNAEEMQPTIFEVSHCFTACSSNR